MHVTDKSKRFVILDTDTEVSFFCVMYVLFAQLSGIKLPSQHSQMICCLSLNLQLLFWRNHIFPSLRGTNDSILLHKCLYPPCSHSCLRRYKVGGSNIVAKYGLLWELEIRVCASHSSRNALYWNPSFRSLLNSCDKSLCVTATQRSGRRPLRFLAFT